MTEVALERKALVTLSVGIENQAQSKKLIQQFGTVPFACACVFFHPAGSQRVSTLSSVAHHRSTLTSFSFTPRAARICGFVLLATQL